ncbi:MAG: hypothetical protein A2X86_21690 [Bdellovibrionales bacterium GWA2_49_15]|nr:MAG: hypothetical protein A2X86_21690 [Bdellovibrionales bacterium GWA2_49_15]
MDAIKRTTQILFQLCFVFLLLMQKTYAGGKYSVKFLFNLFGQLGDEGKQVYDDSGNQNLAVFEPMIFVEHWIDEKTNVNAQFVFDVWTAASDTRLDGNSGASGGGVTGQTRTAGKLAYGHKEKSHAWSTNLGISNEYDYRSLNFGGNFTQNFAQDNFFLSLSPQLFLDQAASYDVERSDTNKFKIRKIYSLDLSGSQFLSDSDVLNVGYTYIGMQGMLNNIANTVKVLDNTTDRFSRTGERLPSSRNRHAAYAKYVHAFSDETALYLNYRYYTDDWKVTAHTYEINPRFSLSEGNQFLMFSYRYYDQKSSQYYADQFATALPLMTSDSDMDTLMAHRYGVHFSQISEREKIFNLKIEDLEYTTALYYSQRSNGLKYAIVQLAVGTSF